MKKALVLGGCGFIGTNLCLRMKKLGIEVTAFDRKAKRELNDAGVSFIQGEFTADTDFVHLTQDYGLVYHLISSTVPGSKGDCFEEEFRNNVQPSIALMEACITNGNSLIFVSSGGTVYGAAGQRPNHEDDQTNPICHYGVQKLMIEKYLQLYHHLHGLAYKIIRLSNPYGPHQIPNSGQGVLTTFAYNAYYNREITVIGDGSAVRDYIYIDDAVKGILHISLEDSKEHLYNLGSGTGHSLNDIIAILEKVLGKKCIIHYKDKRAVDVAYNVLDVSRYKEEFREDESTELEEGIQKLVDFFKNDKAGGGWTV